MSREGSIERKQGDQDDHGCHLPFTEESLYDGTTENIIELSSSSSEDPILLTSTLTDGLSIFKINI